MGLRPDALDEHARVIIESPRIRGKLVVLCEGQRMASADRGKRPSPQTYRRQERLPDASFYRSCVPLRRWHNRGIPCFLDLVVALFTVTKAKPHWRRIMPPSDGSYTDTPAHYRGQLALLVGRHIASLPASDHPIAGFIEHLLQRR